MFIAIDLSVFVQATSRNSTIGFVFVTSRAQQQQE